MDERQKIDLKQHALTPVSKWYLIRISVYVILLILVSFAIYFIYNHKQEATPVKNPEKIQEIRGVKLSDSAS